MAKMLTIRELAKRFNDSEQTVRRTLRKLIQAGRLKPGADYRIENEADPHHRVYFAVPFRFRDEAAEMSPKSGLGRKLISIRGGSDIRNGDIKGESDISLASRPGPGTAEDGPYQGGTVDIKPRGSDIKRTRADIKPPQSDIKQGDISDPDWKPAGFVAYLLRLKDDLIEALTRENEQKGEQIKLMTGTIRQQQAMLDTVTQERDDLRDRLELPAPQPVHEWDKEETDDAELSDDAEAVGGLDERQAFLPIEETWVGAAIILTETEIVQELFEIWRLIERARQNPSRETYERLEQLEDRLAELASGLSHPEWRSHASDLQQRAVDVRA